MDRDRTARTRSAVVAAAAVAAALVSAAPAGAHAYLKRSDPAAGSTLQTAPREVRLVFDEPVRPASGTAVLNAGHSVVAGRPYVPAGHENEIVIPLQHPLGSGPYAVVWSEIDPEDGHRISGAFIFSVGAGPPIPAATTAAQGGNGPRLSAVVSRWLLLVGLLVAAGAAAFDLLVWRPALRDVDAVAVGARVGRASALVLAAALGVAALGAVLTVVFEAGTTSTHFGRRTLVGACIAAAAAVVALASLRASRLRIPAGLVAVVLLALPTATGHASSPGVPHALSVPADLAHLAAAAVWFGGLLELAVVAPLVLRREDRPFRRSLHGGLARRFTPFAVGAVALLGVTGVIRALNELDAVHQLWTTGYGRALLVKTGLLGVLLVLGALNLRGFALRRVAPELALVVVLIGAVAVLTNVRPGRDYPKLAAAAGSTSHTVVVAGQDDDLAVGIALTPHEKAVDLRATVLGFAGPVRGLAVDLAVEGDGMTRRAAASACGNGCYRATLPFAGRPGRVTATIAGRGRPPATLAFDAPTQWPAPSGLEIVRHAEQVIDGLHSLVVHSRLASDAKHTVTTVYRMVAPDRLAFRNDDGSASVIIGNRRWDTDGNGHWTAAPQDPSLRQPAPFWPPHITNASVLRTARVDGRPTWVVSFLDPATPAWFTAWVDRDSYRTLRLDMVAVAHFMHDRDGPFNEPVSVEPPGS